LTTAQNHLADLTKEIAATAREEIDARNALTLAIQDEEARQFALDKLGACPQGQTPDTTP
jgi:hypothetical protein